METRHPGADETRPKINLSRDEEVSAWAERLGVSKDDLRQTIIRVGPLAEDVERELKP